MLQPDSVEQANIEALKPVYVEWRRGNWRPRFEVYSEEMEWGWSDEFPGMAGISADPVDRSRRLREWLSPWEDWRCEAEDYVAAGEYVVALTRYTGRGKESGVAVDVQGAHLWRMRDGKAILLEVYSSRRRALEAAGLG
jgi:ketosteroid isomerase-like protein